MFRAIFYRSSGANVSIAYLSAIFAVGTDSLNQLICIDIFEKPYQAKTEKLEVLFSSYSSHLFSAYTHTFSWIIIRALSHALYYTFIATCLVLQLFQEVIKHIFRKFFNLPFHLFSCFFCLFNHCCEVMYKYFVQINLVIFISILLFLFLSHQFVYLCFSVKSTVCFSFLSRDLSSTWLGLCNYPL